LGSTKPTSKRTQVVIQRHYLIDRRLSLGYSVELASRKVNVTANYYYQIENGHKGKKLSVVMLLKIAKMLNISKYDLIDLEEEYIELLRMHNQSD